MMFSSPVSIRLSSGASAPGEPPTTVLFWLVTETSSAFSIGTGR